MPTEYRCCYRHVKFKGHVVVTDNIESDMIVRATGSLTVGGFIESADVQAQGDINVAKGIIGHNVSEDEKKSCVVKAEEYYRKLRTI